jgi:hypothetical protein
MSIAQDNQWISYLIMVYCITQINLTGEQQKIIEVRVIHAKNRN